MYNLEKHSTPNNKKQTKKQNSVDYKCRTLTHRTPTRRTKSESSAVRGSGGHLKPNPLFEEDIRLYDDILKTELEVLRATDSTAPRPNKELIGVFEEILKDLTPQVGFDAFSSMGAAFLERFNDPESRAQMLNVVQTISWLSRMVKKVDCFQDALCVLDYVTRIHFGQPVLSFVWGKVYALMEPEAQSMDWTILKDIVTGYEAVKNHPVVIKFIRLLSVGFAGGFLATLGLESNVAEMWFQLRGVTSVAFGHCDFISALIDIVYFVGERISAFVLTKDWRNLLHTPTNHSAWVDKSYRLFEHQACLSNAEAVGFDYHQHTKDLCDAITEGESIRKFLKSADQKDAVSGVLGRLRTCYNDILIKDACGKFRMSPFAILLSTGSGVGKSSFVDLIVAHYANLRNKPLADEFIYTRTASEDHYNNFKTSMWACILDDIASIHPNKGTEDPSLMDILQLVNNVPFSPPQAALEDKGRTPFMCELVVATTNTEDLSAHSWFKNPQAIRRRLPYVVNAVPKTQFCQAGTTMLDPSKVPTPLPGCYPDIWDITVKKVTVTQNPNGTESVLSTPILKTSDVYTFVSHFNTWVDEHRSNQAAFMAARTATRAAVLCTTCRLPTVACKCGAPPPNSPTPPPPGGGGDAPLDPPPPPSEGVTAGLEAQVGSTQSPQVSLGGIVGGSIGAMGAAYITHRTLAAGAAVISEDIRILGRNPLFLVGVISDRVMDMVYEDFSGVADRAVVWTIDKVKKALTSWWWTKWKEVSPKLVLLMKALVILGGVGLTYNFLRKIFPGEFDTQVPQMDVDDLDFVGTTPARGAEVENVWRKETYASSEFMGRLSTAWSSLDHSKVASLVSRNVVWCKATHSGNKNCTFRAFCVGGHIYAVPNHVLPRVSEWMMQVIHENDSEGCNGNVRFRMCHSEVLRHPELELAFFEICHMPVRRDLRELLPRRGQTFDGPGRLLLRMPDGSLEQYQSKRSHLRPSATLSQFGIVADACESFLSQDTRNGECGAPVVVALAKGYAIGGLHTLGGTNHVSVSMVLYRETVDDAVAHFGRAVVDAGYPNLEEQSFTTNVSEKCTARFIEDGTVQVFGSFGGFKRQPKSTACDTLFTPHLLDMGHTRKHGPAPMKGYTAVHLALKPMVQKMNLFDVTRLKTCTDSFFKDVFPLIPESSRAELRTPLSLMAALNGVPGVKFVDSMNFNTSAGFPYNKSKRHFITVAPAFGDWQHPVIVNDQVKREIAETWTKMSAGERCAPVFMQHLKDEALPLTKVQAGKARVMMGGPFAWSVCVRMALLPFVRVMQTHKYLFESAPGTNATSVEWQRLFEYLSAFGSNYIGGDFRTFDKSMGALVILEAFRFIVKILEASGAPEEDVLRVWVIGEDIAFVFCNYNGDLMMFFGSNPSGHPLTVIINCIVNCLYMRYCYWGLNPDHEVWTFKQNVRLITYGDDNAAGSRVDWFNHQALVEQLSEVGIEYTTADKSSRVVSFIGLDELTFLQRSFRWSDDLRSHVATLNVDSIWRSLMIQVPSTTETKQKQSVDTVRSAVAEWFLYGEERFDAEVAVLKELVRRADLECYVEKGTFLTYAQLKARYIQVSEEYLATEPSSTRKLLGASRWVAKDEGVVGTSPIAESQKPTPPDSYCSLVVQSTCETSESVGLEVTSQGQRPAFLFRNRLSDGAEHVDCECTYGCKCAQRKAPTNTITKSQGGLVTIPQWGDLRPQSEELESGSLKMSSHENLMFADAGDAGSVALPMVSYAPDSDTIAHLGSYLSRPVLINSFSWSEGPTPVLLTQFNPWSLFFNNVAIRNKLTNFARLRAKLHVKIVVNASPFYYGAVRVAYCPLDGGLRDIVETSGDQIKFSQFPGKMVYPSEMTTFEMDLPFLWPRAWLNLEDLSEFADMGRLSYINYSNLRSANGTTGQNVTISCYAWASDVELAGLTSGLVMQSDEYSDPGPISGPASAVANIASKLADVPVIGDLARATEIGAGAVASVARMFGYSNPPVISDAMPFMPKAFHGLSSVDTSIPSDKLSVDPKNEVTINNTVAGASADDELVVSHFAGRESWVAGSLWVESYGPGTQLMVIPVTPRLYAANNGVSQSIVNETPAAHVSAMFEQWRGSITYKFHFVKSRYHTGRVQISWDPQAVPGTGAETTTLTRIVDLQVESEVTFTVPYKASSPWLSTDADANLIVVATTGTPALQPERYNGYVRVTVLNELTGPAASQQIDLLAFAQCGSDFELSVPNELPLWSFLTVQSLEEEDIVPGAGGSRDVSTNAVTVGETVPSLRPLLHRSSLYHRQPVGNPYTASTNLRLSALCLNVNYIPRFPVEYGFSTQGVNYATGILTPTKNQFQFSPNHPLGWVSNCFVGYRGALVHHFNVIANGGQLVDELKAEVDPRVHIIDVAPRQAINRFTNSITTADPSTLARLSITTQSGVGRDVLGQRGMAMTNANTQGALSVVSPQYSKWKFRPAYCKRRDVLDGESEAQSIKVVSMMRCGNPSTSIDEGWPTLSVYVAGGVDFQPVFFSCVPTMYAFVIPSPDNTF